MWYVYILKCSDGTLYTGITNDIKRRVGEHNSSELGAKYTRGRRPVKLMYARGMDSKVEAMREEYRIKRLSKEKKEGLCNQ
ncbi:GIY-YIG nuclease family protein [Patescibacteria group bacterium]|nr:GIY-YIG nuclease family protein [Patescibacteria group bacterium]